MSLMVLLTIPLLLLVVVAMAFLVWNGNRKGAERLRLARTRVANVTEIAYGHDEMSPVLASAVIDRLSNLRPDSAVHSLEQALEDVLALARRHRDAEADLAVIVIDAARSSYVPRELR